jgi:hypothetical protein
VVLPKKRLDHQLCKYDRHGAHRHKSSIDPVLHPFSYCFHFLFHFLDHFLSHQDPILKPISTQRHPTWSPVKKLKRCHLNGSLVTIVISEFYQWKEFFQSLLLVHYVHVQHVLQGLVGSFDLSVSLRVIHSTKVKLGSQGLLETSPKSSSKH